MSTLTPMVESFTHFRPAGVSLEASSVRVGKQHLGPMSVACETAKVRDWKVEMVAGKRTA